MAAPDAHAPPPDDPRDALSRETIAAILVARRDRLLRQLPRQITRARSLTTDQREWVIDEATDYLVTQNEGTVANEDALERAFWTVANYRVRRMCEGRHNTVRAGWKRVDVDDVELPDAADTPEDAAIHGFERKTLDEFAAELSADERSVLALKYSGAKELGRFQIAGILGRKPHEIRRIERAIDRKLKAFSAIVAAGSLCDERQTSLQALAHGRASTLDHQRAHTHLEHCSPCRMEYTSLVRAIRSGELPREIGQILPPPVIDAVERHRGPWEIIVDWLSRPFGHDVTITAAQLAPVGRGLSTFAGAKLISICLGSAAAVSGSVFCVVQVTRDQPPDRPRVVRETPDERPKRTPTPKPVRTVVAATATPTPTRTPKPKKSPPKKQRERGGEVSRGSSSHEQAAAISPPATAPGGEAVSEFEPGPATSAPSRPAAAPVNGGPEFP